MNECDVKCGRAMSYKFNILCNTFMVEFYSGTAACSPASESSSIRESHVLSDKCLECIFNVLYNFQFSSLHNFVFSLLTTACGDQYRMKQYFKKLKLGSSREFRQTYLNRLLCIKM